MRGFIFQAGFWALAGVLAVIALPTLAFPGRKPAVGAIALFAKLFRAWLRVCGVRVVYRGLEHLDNLGPVVFAAKHQSYGDGLCHLARDADLAYVIGDHMLRFPVIGLYLAKAEAVVVDDAAGRRRGDTLAASLARLRGDGRSALIFPEGGLTDVGAKKRYRRGAHRLASALERPIVPAATNLGCFWPKRQWRLHPGVAVIEFLPPLAASNDARETMAAVEAAVETRTRALEAEARAAQASKREGANRNDA